MRSLVLWVGVLFLASCNSTSTAPDLTWRGEEGREVMPLSAWDRDQDGVVRIAHRGYGCCFPENTLPAMYGAFRLGADAVEMDVWLSKDGVPVLMHDSTLVRTTGAAGRVYEKSYAELRSLDACGRWPLGPHPSCRVPTLEAALSVVRPLGYAVIDFKPPVGDSAAVRAVLEAIVQAQMENRVVVASDVPEVLLAFRAVNAHVPLALLSYQKPAILFLKSIAPSMSLVRTNVLAADPKIIKTSEENGIPIGAFTVRTLEERGALHYLGVKRVISAVPLRP